MSDIVNFTVTKDGLKASAVCRWCDKHSRPVRRNHRGEPDLWALPVGWCQAPHGSDTVHGDGSTGSLWTCPACDKRRFASLKLHESRVDARLIRRMSEAIARRADSPTVQQYSPRSQDRSGENPHV